MPRIIPILLFLVVFLCKNSLEQQDQLRLKQQNHRPSDLSAASIKNIAKLSNNDNLNSILDKLLVERVVGTQGHEDVKDFIAKYMKDLNWSVELDEFEDQTPIFGTLKFTNIIATLNPNAERYITLACHYDSKYFKGKKFIGATDSAVPCAMMLNLAYVMDNLLKTKKDDNSLSLQLIFFDGEEAFREWGPADSIYGARHLAAKWEQENVLPKLDMIILLDLLGAPDPTFYSYFQNTEAWYARLLYGEQKLEKGELLDHYSYSNMATRSPIPYFQPHSVNAYIEDDHIPFLRRGVPILHLIPSPFPSFWHKMKDDRSSIDMTTIENLNKIFRVFIVEYLHLNP